MKRAPVRFVSRADAVRQLRAQLEHGGWPRAQMMLLVMLTGASGFLASWAMLANGLSHMGARYLLACCAAYLVFLCLLWIWIRSRGRVDGFDAIDLVEFPSGRGGGWSGTGRQSGGAGASARFDAPDGPSAGTAPASTPPSAATAAPVDEGGFGLDVDVDAIPVLLALLVAALVLSSLFVVWTAPALFAELLLDGVLAAGLYRRLRHIETRHWLRTALRKTVVPFLLTAAVLCLGGIALQAAAPGADSIGDVLELL